MLIANLASFFTLHEDEPEVDPAVHELQDKLGHVHEMSENELAALRGAVTGLIDHHLNKIITKSKKE